MAMGRVFFLTYTATPEIYTLSLHDALPISAHARPAAPSVADRWIRSRLNATVGLVRRSEEHTSEPQSPAHLVCRLLLEKKQMPNGPPSPRTRPRRATSPSRRSRRRTPRRGA